MLQNREALFASILSVAQQYQEATADRWTTSSQLSDEESTSYEAAKRESLAKATLLGDAVVSLHRIAVASEDQNELSRQHIVINQKHAEQNAEFALAMDAYKKEVKGFNALVDNLIKPIMEQLFNRVDVLERKPEGQVDTQREDAAADLLRRVEALERMVIP